jgi:hypothetical protein
MSRVRYPCLFVPTERVCLVGAKANKPAAEQANVVKAQEASYRPQATTPPKLRVLFQSSRQRGGTSGSAAVAVAGGQQRIVVAECSSRLRPPGTPIFVLWEKSCRAVHKL